MKNKNTMRTLFILLIALISYNALCQRTDNWFDFPDRHTLGSKGAVNVQYNLFLDPLGRPPSGESGRQFGVEMVAIMGGLYAAPSMSWFPQLKDGYFDAVISIGMNWHMFQTSSIRYYSGLRMGKEWRKTSVPFGIVGFSIGADMIVIDFNGGGGMYIGAELWVDHRASQADQFYGDSTGYSGGLIFSNSQARENGKIKLGFRLF